jgi:hypothetical protein
MPIHSISHSRHWIFMTIMSLNIHKKIIICSIVVIFVLLMYDEFLHLLVEFFHLAFESAEYTFDLVIEHLFETDTHETQVIVFYILVPLILCIFYLLYHFLPVLYVKFKHFLQLQKTETLMQWQALSVTGKIAWWSFFILVLNCWLFLL